MNRPWGETARIPSLAVSRLPVFLLAGFALALCRPVKPGQEPATADVTIRGNIVSYLYAPAPPAAMEAPLLVYVRGTGGSDPAANEQSVKAVFETWRGATAAQGWHLLMPALGAGHAAVHDGAVTVLAAMLEDFATRFKVDRTRVYLAGDTEGANLVFYAASRTPDLWTAALAIQGHPKPAIDTNRLFGANTSLVPVRWLVRAEDRERVRPFLAKLKSAEYNVELAGLDNASLGQTLEWLGARKRDRFPLKIDCETGNPAFARCYWIELTGFDPARRNDVLRPGRVPPGSGAYLALGGFGYDATQPGPGITVSWLPPNYTGPLKLGDRILAIAGKPIANADEYARLLEETAEEKAVAIRVQRGKEQIRLETRILLPKREELITARVRAEYSPESGEVLVLTRAVKTFRITIPKSWTPVSINWNGNVVLEAREGGCWNVTEDGSPTARPCEG